MEAAAGLAMQSRAVGAGPGPYGRRSGALGGDGPARAVSLRVGGPAAAAPEPALRVRGARPVAPLCCVKTSRGLSV